MKRPVPFRVKETMKDIGHDISAWRKLLGMKAETLAFKASVSKDTISRLENGDPGITMATFLNVCHVLHLAEGVEQACDPFETDFGRLRGEQNLPERVR